MDRGFSQLQEGAATSPISASPASTYRRSRLSSTEKFQNQGVVGRTFNLHPILEALMDVGVQLNLHGCAAAFNDIGQQ